MQKFINEVISWLSQQGIYIILDETSFLFGLLLLEDDINKLVLMEIKYYIYYARCSKSRLSLTVLKQRLKLQYQTYKQASVQSNTYELFHTKWQNYHKFLNNAD